MKTIYERMIRGVITADHSLLGPAELGLYTDLIGNAKSIGIECECPIGHSVLINQSQVYYLKNSLQEIGFKIFQPDVECSNYFGIKGLEKVSRDYNCPTIEICFLFSVTNPIIFSLAVKKIYNIYTRHGFSFNGGLHINMQLPSSRGKEKNKKLKQELKCEFWEKSFYRTGIIRYENKYFGPSYSWFQLISQILIGAILFRKGTCFLERTKITQLMFDLCEERGEIIYPPFSEIGLSPSGKMGISLN